MAAMELTHSSPAHPRRWPLGKVSGSRAAVSSMSGSRPRRVLSFSKALEGEGEEGRRLRRESGRELAKILRAEAAVAGMERKAATATSTRRLWPKALLGALEEAMSGGRWESALQEAN